MNKRALILSAAVAGIISAGTSNTFAVDAKTDKAPTAKATPAEPMGQCEGTNACKGKGECGGKDHACGGKNACKGKGWNKATKKDCDLKKGTWQAKKA